MDLNQIYSSENSLAGFGCRDIKYHPDARIFSDYGNERIIPFRSSSKLKLVVESLQVGKQDRANFEEINTNCALCRIPAEERVVETENFFISPTVGHLNIPWLMIMSKACTNGIASLNPKLYSELDYLIEITNRVLKNRYDTDIVFFEHGPRTFLRGSDPERKEGEIVNGGGCIEHLHVHAVVGINGKEFVGRMGNDLILSLKEIGQFYAVSMIGGFNTLAEMVYGGHGSYVWVQYFQKDTGKEVRLMQLIKRRVASQWGRKIISDQIGLEKGAYDYGLYSVDDFYLKLVSDFRFEFEKEVRVSQFANT